MVDYTKVPTQYMTDVEKEDAMRSVFRSVYGWMTMGLLVSGLTAWYTVQSGLYRTVMAPPWFWVCLIAEFALVIGLSAGIRALSAGVASLMFVLYSVVNGLTLSVIFLAYTRSSIQSVFFIAAGMFAGLALIGSMTRKNLSGIGATCGMALWGVILVMVVNLFTKSARIDWALSLVGVVLFSGLTLWDAQKIRILARLSVEEGGSADIKKASIIGALQLYLDFINLFLSLLRIVGKRR